MTVTARLKGLISPLTIERRIVRQGEPVPDPDTDPSASPIEIRDARVLQASLGSAAACFERHGFAVLNHRSEVTDWRAPFDIAVIYHPEIEAMIRQQLLPDRSVADDQSLGLVYRGGDDDVIYADRVHQDFGLGVDDFALNLATAADPAAARAWQDRYWRDDVAGCTAISFWRTIGLGEPLRHKPLALCDPASVAMADVRSAASPGAAAYHIDLRFNAEQRWYHYPGLRPDEVLAFKLFECRKDDPVPSRLRSVFHTAFDDPGMPADAERRFSCEHRAIVTLFRD